MGCGRQVGYFQWDTSVRGQFGEEMLEEVTVVGETSGSNAQK